LLEFGCFANIMNDLWFKVGIAGSVEILDCRRIKQMQPSLSNGGKYLGGDFFVVAPIDRGGSFPSKSPKRAPVSKSRIPSPQKKE